MDIDLFSVQQLRCLNKVQKVLPQIPSFVWLETRIWWTQTSVFPNCPITLREIHPRSLRALSQYNRVTRANTKPSFSEKRVIQTWRQLKWQVWVFSCCVSLSVSVWIFHYRADCRYSPGSRWFLLGSSRTTVWSPPSKVGASSMGIQHTRTAVLLFIACIPKSQTLNENFK